MDKNTLVGAILIGAVVIGFSIYSRPSQEEMERAQHYQDSIETVVQQQEEQMLKAKQAEAAQVLQADSTSQFFAHTQGTEQFTTLENNVVQITLSNKGGRVSKAMLKEYNDQQKQPLVLFDGDDASLNIGFEGKNENILSSNLYFETTDVTDSTVTMRLNAANGGHLDFKYRLLPDSYMLDFTVQASGLQNFFSPAVKTMTIDWKQRARQMEKGYNFEQRYTSLTYKPVGDSFDYLSETKDEQASITEPLDWVAFKNQYFSCVFMAEKNFENATLDSKMEEKSSGYMKNYHAGMQTAFDPTGTQPSHFQFYFGPNHFKTLLASNDLSFKDKDQELEDLVYLGWPIIRLINRWFTINLFDWLSGLGLSMGVVILLMTIIVKILVLPTTWKSFISSAKMRALKPYVDKINEKYPKQEDALKKQQETMSLYSQYGVSPMGGCLPMLIQTPVFMALFFFVPNAIELRQQSFLWASDLSSYDDLIHWSTSIPLLGNHLSLFCLLFSATTVINQIIMMKQQDTGANPQMAAMKWMMYIMPVMFFFIFNEYASGLSYYYFISGLIGILTMWIMRRMTDEKKLLAQLEANKKAPSERKQSGLMAKLEALQKEQERLQKEREGRMNKKH
ncbi:membrane protein insertase YidC [Bacteroides gallinaceum]|uniref:membrane protein insertase YidC n=1 Tax=Bacteroides TaxID=816 RepID=UPI0003366C18|nr:MULTISPECIES: membrane protein insertase YidC [Bacteroides]CCZ70226.1 membrane protein insertase YidC [Bacteroides sp. CAG:702]MBM6659333.1 membrane protein insertase YidC [Bacteroides gallinaceum]MBM6946636.1 membrane protein insertase YidC [Bacteroides gallinaceum]MDN0064993.1 membrane protein insertase YidC [Bacteroides gallinaceum]MDN0079490.1 membrane protein insertase YidC [Bacteroides gallinaceum]